MNTFFTRNRSKFAAHMESGDFAVFFAGSAPKSTADAHYSFLQNKNFYYLTGCKQEHFILTLHKNDTSVETTLYIEKPDYDIEKWIGRKLTREQAKDISGIDNIHFLSAFESNMTRFIYDNKIKRILLDLEKLDWNAHDADSDRFARDILKRYPFIQILTAHPILSQLRMIKDSFEIEQIEKAVEMTKDGLDAILKILKPDVFEYQLDATFSHSIRMAGADGISFPTIAASGEDGVILHYVENAKPMKDGDLVLLDLGAQYQQYAADISRTYPVGGRFSERQKTLYNSVLKAQNAVIDAIKPGFLFEDLNKVCQESLFNSLKEIGLIEKKEELSKYYYHGVSHHLGLDVHDLGNRTGALEPGMVLTVEPGLYVAEENIGIRIEEDVLVTEEGNRVLSIGIPKTVEEIEAVMSGK